MASVELERAFAFPIHPKGWRRPAGSRDYIVTAGFSDPDLVNAGAHRAVDLGNFGRGDLLRAPAAMTARAWRHWDGALGVELRIADVAFALWHLDRLDIPERWGYVAAGQPIGLTGGSGRVTGAHTHVELTRAGVRIDPEPYLLGRDLIIDTEADMPTFPAADMRSIEPRRYRTLTGARFRSAPTLTAESILGTLPAGAVNVATHTVDGAVANGSALWHPAWFYVDGRYRAGFVHSTAVETVDEPDELATVRAWYRGAPQTVR